MKQEECITCLYQVPLDEYFFILFLPLLFIRILEHLTVQVKVISHLQTLYYVVINHRDPSLTSKLLLMLQNIEGQIRSLL